MSPRLPPTPLHRWFTAWRALRRWLAGPAPLLLALCLAALPGLVHAAGRAVPALLLDDSLPRQSAWPAITMLADPGQALTLDDVLRQTARFVVPDTPDSNLGVRRDAVWFRLPLHVRGGDGRWLLDIDYPPLNQIDAYLLSDGHLVQHWRLGSAQAFGERPVPSRTHVAPLWLMPDGRYEVYLRVQTQSSMLVPISLAKPEAHHARESGVQLVQGMLAGLALALLVYSLAHWLSLRNTMFGLYALMVGGSAIFFLSYFGLVQQYLWPAQHLSDLGAKLSPLSVLLALTAAGRFIALSLDTATHHPRIHRGLNLLSMASGLALLISMLGLLGYRATQAAPTLLGPGMLLLSVPAAWSKARRGDRVGLFMLVGWTAYMLGAMAMASLLRGWIPANAWTQHLFQAGWMLEMLAWLRVLGLHIEAVRRDAERTEVEKRTLESLAYTDALTGLPNRRGLNQALEAALADCRAGGAGGGGERALAVFLLDLDGFKPVNDRLGHEAGDELLVQVGQRLKRQVRHSDVVARLGGDEFVIVAQGLGGEVEALTIGRKLLDAFREPFHVVGESCKVGLTIGFALAPHDGHQAADLLKRADAAMYAGKQAGRHTVRRGAASHGLA